MTPTPTPSASAAAAAATDDLQYFEIQVSDSTTTVADNPAYKVNSSNFGGGFSSLEWPAGATGFMLQSMASSNDYLSGEGVGFNWAGLLNTDGSDGTNSLGHSVPYDNKALPAYVNVPTVDPEDDSNNDNDFADLDEMRIDRLAYINSANPTTTVLGRSSSSPVYHESIADGPHIIDFGLVQCTNATCSTKNDIPVNSNGQQVVAKNANNDPLGFRIVFSSISAGYAGIEAFEGLPPSTIIGISGKFLS